MRFIFFSFYFFDYRHDLYNLRLDASIIPFPVSAHLVSFFFFLHICLDPQVSIILTNQFLYQMSTVYAVAERVSSLFFFFIHLPYVLWIGLLIFIIYLFLKKKAVDFIKEDYL